MSKIDYGAWEKFIDEQDISSDEAPTVIKYKAGREEPFFALLV